jgi:streptogramin lyase
MKPVLPHTLAIDCYVMDCWHRLAAKSWLQVEEFSMHLFNGRPSSYSLLAISPRTIRFLWLALCLTLGFILAVGFNPQPVLAESNEATAVHATFGLEYAVPNGPRNLAAEAPGRIWYTATDAGGIGFLEVISDTNDSVVRYRTEFYGFGANSQPYDLVYNKGVVWFTLRGIRALGRIDVATREIKTYMLLSVGAAPTGIDVAPDGQLWIAQSNGRVSRFDPTTETFHEFVLPGDLAQTPRMEDVAVQDARTIWFTMPDGNRVVIYDPIQGKFFNSPTGEEAPMNISIDPDHRVWVTAYGTSRVGRFTPTTVSIWIWFDTPTPNSGPAGLLTYKDENGILQVWLAESKTGTIGRLEIANGFEVTNRERLGPNTPAGSTWGIIRSADEHIWVADSGRNLIYELTKPYIHRIYAAVVRNGQAPQP